MDRSPASKKKGEAAGGPFYPEWLVEALEMQGDDLLTLPRSPGEPKSAAAHGRNGESEGSERTREREPLGTGEAGGGTEATGERERVAGHEAGGGQPEPEAHPEPGATRGAEDAPEHEAGHEQRGSQRAESGASRERTTYEDLWQEIGAPARDADAQPAQGNGHGPPRRRHLYLGFESTRVPPRSFRCRVMIQLDGHEHIGESVGPEIPGVRAEITARATLEALKKAEGNRIELALLGARVLRIFDRAVAVVGVYGLDDEVQPLIGACLVRESIEQATALATLQATNRWVGMQAATRMSNVE